MLNRRSFMQGLASLVAMFGLQRLSFAQSPTLPVVQFDDKGLICNNTEVMGDTPWETCKPCRHRDPRWWDNYAWKRQRLVWVNEVDAIRYHTGNKYDYNASRVWGELLLEETVDEDTPKGESLKDSFDRLQKMGRLKDGKMLIRYELKPTNNTKTKHELYQGGNYWASDEAAEQIMETK